MNKLKCLPRIPFPKPLHVCTKENSSYSDVIETQSISLTEGKKERNGTICIIGKQEKNWWIISLLITFNNIFLHLRVGAIRLAWLMECQLLSLCASYL